MADIYWYQTDLNSAPLEVTNAAKRQGAQYQQPLRYAGQYQDDESGLHYNLFRYYEPADVGGSAGIE